MNSLLFHSLSAKISLFFCPVAFEFIVVTFFEKVIRQKASTKNQSYMILLKSAPNSGLEFGAGGTPIQCCNL